MKARASARAALRLRLALRANPLLAGACLGLLVCHAALAWTCYRSARLEQDSVALRLAVARAAARPAPAPVSVAPAPAPAAPDALAAFQAALGPRRYAEQQVKTLFALAARHGLSLSQGEYKSAYDRNAGIHTYQIELPVKGGYEAIWGFALDALRAIPFAALDDIGFRRDGIGDPAVEARLRLTLYLKDLPGEAP